MISSDVSSVFFNTDDFAEIVLRYVGGDDSNVATIPAAVVFWNEPQLREESGRDVMQTGVVTMPTTQTITTADALSIGGVRCEIERIETVGTHGMRSVYVKRKIADIKGRKMAEGI